MSKKVIVVGAVAAGSKAACRIKRRDPSAEVTLIDKDDYISYAGCGIPFFVGGDVADLEGLLSTFAHVKRDPTYFEKVKGVSVKTATEAIAVDRKAKQLTVRNLSDSTTETLSYDQLVLATGSIAAVPQLPGIDLPGVFFITNLHQAQKIKEMISKGLVESAAVIGGGAKGLGMAEALTDLWGIETTLIEKEDHLAPNALGRDMARLVENHLRQNDVDVRLSARVTRIAGDAENGVEAVECDGEKIPCQMVIVTAGTLPNAKLARDAGLAIGATGGIIVDAAMRTSDPDIFAGGDCVELPHMISGSKIHMPMGSLANQQGRVIGTNITGGRERFPGTIGSFCLKVFELGVARAGLTADQAATAGFDPVAGIVVQSDRAHFYPTQELMYLKLIADRKTRRVLGIEALGTQGDAVKARVDAVAAMLQFKPDLNAVANLEIGHAPPLAASLDIVNNAANSLENIIEGRQVAMKAEDFLKLFKQGKTRVLDVRSDVQAGPYVEKYSGGWTNIPQDQLPERIGDIPPEPFLLVCGSGPRSYESQLYLRQKGFQNTKNIEGGIGMIKFTDPDFPPSENH